MNLLNMEVSMIVHRHGLPRTLVLMALAVDDGTTVPIPKNKDLLLRLDGYEVTPLVDACVNYSVLSKIIMRRLRKVTTNSDGPVLRTPWDISCRSGDTN